MKTSLSDWFNGGGTALEEEHQQEPPKQGDQQPPKQEDQQHQEDIDYAAKYNRFKDLDVPEFDELITLVQAEEGEDLPAKIKAIKTKYEQSSQIEELNKAHAEREAWYRKHKITGSQEFQEKFEKPVAKNLDIYSALMSEVDSEGNYKNEERFQKLRQSIWNEGAEITVPKIKAIFKAFSDQYKERFGAEPDLPSIKEVVDARDELLKAQQRKQTALEQWEQLREQETEQEKATVREQQQLRLSNALAETKDKFKGFKESLKHDDYSFMPKEDFDKIVTSFEQDFVGMAEGKIKKEVADYLPEGLKARAYDKLMEEYKSLKKYVDDKLGGPPKPRGDAHEDKKPKEETTGSLSAWFGI
jgi:hypothetical protein